MRKLTAMLALAAVISAVVVTPAFALTGADGAGKEFGAHHASHAQEMKGFDGEMNPGVMHSGFSGWAGM